MKTIILSLLLIMCFTSAGWSAPEFVPKTIVTIEGNDFYINGKITLKGINLDNISIEGLLPNSRMVQGIFDDLNPETRQLWKYPDTGIWDPDRNTNARIL